ncbi:sterile alpha motif domain-containing protein 9-like isoform X2 [Dreissena polymorpha]|uniref:sterile alpha motif domain-containing protein 9-like isoform X2 n=1 Tax=Dreissena polymorpha TaxID=45954 RepID=UPI00226532A7|nr:sterile alpha motif domain-containing protein 9-like isoform X2 [Dreissena polymorpha]
MTELFEKNDSLTEDDCLETKYQIIMGTRCIGRHVDVDVLVDKLRSKEIVSHQKKLEIQQEHDTEEKASLLVLDITCIQESYENVLKFLKCLQKDYPLVVEWIKGDTDDKDIGNKLRDLEVKHITTIIKDAIEANGPTCIFGEDLHIYVEEKRKCFVKFLLIKDCIISTFRDAKFIEKSNRFSGLSWKSHVIMFDETQLPDVVQPLSSMPCEEFSKYLEVEVQKNITKDAKIVNAISDVIKTESISLSFFVDSLEIVEDELRKEFIARGLNYGVGISGGLKKVRKGIKNRLKAGGTECESDFRTFGRSSGNFIYKKVIVKQDVTSMLTPVHCFIMPKREKEMHKSYFAAEVIKFAAACINGLQNGTFHFGIKPLENNEGQIVGLRKSEYTPQTLKAAIENSLHHCFVGPCFEQRIFERAIQAVVIVPCEDESFVVEVDINPSCIFMKDTPVSLLFPPHGEQDNKLYKYISRQGIYIFETVDPKKAESLKIEMKETLHARKILEMSAVKPEKGLSNIRAQLQKRLTAGNSYVTDQMVPHIICGKYSSIANSNKIFNNIRDAFLSSPVVFDFDPSTVLIKNIEKGDNYFDVLVADDYTPEKRPQNIGSGKHWIYCNGNVERKLQSLPISEWLSGRYPFVKCALEESFKVNSNNRSLAVFLVFETILKTDSLYQIALDCSRWYPLNTVVISDKEECFAQLRKDLEPITEPQTLNQIFFSGLSWMDVASEVLSPIFPCVSGSVLRLPTSYGTLVTLTQNETNTMKLCDIEILSCEECKLAFEEMDKTLQDDTFSKKENAFYKGSEASWWNFFFDAQVCQREIFENITSRVEEKIYDGRERVEVLKIFHQPGAGGTTLGRHVLWHFSQCKTDLSKVYRCCVLRNVIENDSADQIFKLWSFKDKNKDERNPVIVLADNIPEESLEILIDNLNTLSYCHGSSHGKLFCLLIVVARIWESKGASDSVVLRQVLSPREKLWFQDRSKFLEKTNSKKQIESMIAFNVMKEGFCPDYINKTTRGIMKGLERKEEKLVQHLSFLNSYKPDVAVRPDIFDDLMEIETSKTTKWTIKELREVGGPVGLVGAQRRAFIPFRQTWNVESTESLELLIKHSSYDGRNRISIVSPLMAKASLQYIMEKESLDLKKVVSDFLIFLETQLENDPNSDSTKEIRKHLCDLFCYRQKQKKPFGDSKSAFSNLVTKLSEVNNWETREEAFQRTNDLMSNCFQITKDPYVGQHRTRLCISFSEFDIAIQAITLVLKESGKVPILYDTFGQIYKEKLKLELTKPNTDPKELIKLACNAIAKFKEAQRLGRVDNLEFYEHEVSVALLVLEYLETRYKGPFLEAINGISHDTNMPELYPEISCFCDGSEMQRHIKASLRHVNDVFTKTKLPFTLRSKPENGLLSMINKFERIYKTDLASSSPVETAISCSFTVVKNQYDKDQIRLKKTVNALECNLEACGNRLEKDLTTVVGFYIIHFSMISCPEFDEKIQYNYKKLLHLSDKLLKCQNERMTNECMNDKVENLEPYLYFSLLHWPLPDRLRLHEQHICKPENLIKALTRWQKLYDQKFYTQKKSELGKVSLSLLPKLFFALAKGQPGGDYVDTDKVRSQWRREADEQGRKRREVKRDDIWNHKLGQETFCRISGIVDGSGRKIHHSVDYHYKTFQYSIPTGEDCSDYRNRSVTFVLGISWRGPIAYGVKLEESESLVPEDNTCQHVGASLTEMDAVQRDRMLLPDGNLTFGEEESCKTTLLTNPRASSDVRESVLPTKTLKSNPGAVCGGSAAIGRGRGRARGIPVACKSGEVRTKPGRTSTAVTPNEQSGGVFPSVSTAELGQFGNAGKAEANIVGTSAFAHTVERDVNKILPLDGAKGGIIHKEEEQKAPEEEKPKRGRRQRKKDKKKENRK